MSKAPTEYKLEELAKSAGVSPRAVRYYVQRGLLPAPAFRGKDTAYGPEHVVRLRAIKKLQEAFLPLDAIASTLGNASESELEAIAAGKVALAAPIAPVVHAPHVRVPKSEHVERYPLAKGVELLVSDGLDAEARALVQEILKTVQQHNGGK